MSKKMHQYSVGQLLRLPETAPSPYTGETRFRVVKVGSKGTVEVTPHAKEKGKPVFSAKVRESIWCPPVTREKYRASKKAEKASTALATTGESETPVVEENVSEGAIVETV